MIFKRMKYTAVCSESLLNKQQLLLVRPTGQQLEKTCPVYLHVFLLCVFQGELRGSGEKQSPVCRHGTTRQGWLHRSGMWVAVCRRALRCTGRTLRPALHQTLTQAYPNHDAWSRLCTLHPPHKQRTAGEKGRRMGEAGEVSSPGSKSFRETDEDWKKGRLLGRVWGLARFPLHVQLLQHRLQLASGSVHCVGFTNRLVRRMNALNKLTHRQRQKKMKCFTFVKTWLPQGFFPKVF